MFAWNEKKISELGNDLHIPAWKVQYRKSPWMQGIETPDKGCIYTRVELLRRKKDGIDDDGENETENCCIEDVYLIQRQHAFCKESSDCEDCESCVYCGWGSKQYALFTLRLENQVFCALMKYWSGCLSYDLDDCESILYLDVGFEDLFDNLNSEQRKEIEIFQKRAHEDYTNAHFEVGSALRWPSSFHPLVDLILSYLILSWHDNKCC
jgi:hypothetical protein